MKQNIFFLFSLACIFVVINSCTKELSFENGVPLSSAEGSLTDSFNNCLPDSVHGTFYNGVTPGIDTAYVEIQVNVTVAGVYSIRTDLQNGFMFSDSGFFNTTGINTIRLKPLGIPVSPTLTNFEISFDSSFCGFSVMVADSTGTGLGGNTGGGTDSTNLSDTAWHFNQDSLAFNGYFQGVSVLDTLGLTYLTLTGFTAATGDSALLINIFLPTNQIVPGTYSTTLATSFSFFDATQNLVYAADPSTLGISMDVIIISYDATTNIITGTFSGTANDALANPVNITGGSFTAKVM